MRRKKITKLTETFGFASQVKILTEEMESQSQELSMK